MKDVISCEVSFAPQVVGVRGGDKIRTLHCLQDQRQPKVSTGSMTMLKRTWFILVQA